MENNNQIAQAFEDAFKRSGGSHFVGEVEGYCENTLCEARHVRTTVKGDTSEWSRADVLHCPMCQEPLKLHGVATLEEVRKHDRLTARSNVNGQLLHEIEKILDSSSCLLPIGMLLADTLPPLCEHVRDYVSGLVGGKE